MGILEKALTNNKHKRLMLKIILGNVSGEMSRGKCKKTILAYWPVLWLAGKCIYCEIERVVNAVFTVLCPTFGISLVWLISGIIY